MADSRQSTHVLLVRVPNLKRADYLQWAGYTPDSLLTLGSYVQAHDFRCKVLDAYRRTNGDSAPEQGEIDSLLDFTWSTLSAAIDVHTPWIVGFSCLSNGDAWTAVSMAERMKASYPEIPVILGGYFPTCNSRQILESCAAVDAVVVGEGEVAMVELLTRLGDGIEPFSEAVPNLCFRQAGGIVSTRRAATLDLSALPPVDFSLLDDPRRYQIFVYHASRGCPWRCSYCTEARMDKGYRTKPYARVVEDIAAFRRLNPSSSVYLSDPILAVTDAKMAGLCEALAPLGIQYTCSTRVDVLTPELVPLMRDSGCLKIYFGLESASFDTLLRMNKLRPATFAQYQTYLSGAVELVKACAANDVHCVVGAMVGYPGDTREDLSLTLNFFRELRQVYFAHRGAGLPPFVVLAFRVDLPSDSDAWLARGYFSQKGLELSDEQLFGDHRVMKSSFRLDEAELDSFAARFVALSTAIRSEKRAAA